MMNPKIIAGLVFLLICIGLFVYMEKVYKTKMAYCMEEGYKEKCAEIHEFNPDFDCENAKVDLDRYEQTWKEGYCRSGGAMK